MRLASLFAMAAASAALQTASAQTRAPDARVFTFDNGERDAHRAALGVSVSATGTLRDTLGVLVSAVTQGSPAARAGLEEGNRIAAINGVSLRANAADVEDDGVSEALTRRLIRELAKTKPGDEVELRVYRDGRTTAMRVRTADSDSLFRRGTGTTFSRAERDDRPALGFGLGSTGSRRDTLGVLVMSVPDSTPAARAGLEEGNRIAAINGVNLRVPSEDAGDPYMGSVKAQRLQREIAQLTPGSDVTLRVYSAGQFRDVRLKVARAADLPRQANRVMIFNGGGFPPMGMTMPPSPARVRVMPRAPMPPGGNFRVEIGPEIRERLREIEGGMERMGPELERMRTELPRALREARAAHVTRVM